MNGNLRTTQTGDRASSDRVPQPSQHLGALHACQACAAPATPRIVVGRYAPSPSGRMHLGNVYAALMAWLSARSQNGRMALRIEDLDPRTNSPERARQLIDDLRWLGLDWDGDVVWQHERIELYRSAVERLHGLGLTYPCFCTRAELHAANAPHAADGTPVYAGTCRNLAPEDVARKRIARPPATRLRVPEESDPASIVAFEDRVYGPWAENLARECGDFLVQRSDGVYAYQLVVVVDDADMGVTEVVRGCDLLGSTARQLYLGRLLGLAAPSYAHVPLLTAPDGRRLSKRDRDCDLGELKRIFGTPERLLGRLAYAAGLAEDPAPRTASQLCDGFSWQAVRTHRENISIDEKFFC